MKEKIFNIIVIVISIFVLIELLIKKSVIYTSIMYALNLWVENLIPALFPFFIISDILINYNITNYIPKFIKEKCKCFLNITDNMLVILLLSMFSGFPSNARNARTFYEKNLITEDEGNHVLMFSHFANPVFIVITVGVYFFHNQKIGIILLITHYLSNLGVALLFKNKFKHTGTDNFNLITNNNFGEVLISAIKRAIDTILLICGIMVVFLTLSSIILSVFRLNDCNSMLVKGILEITIGLDMLRIVSLTTRCKLIIASCILAFGGFSVHLQVISQIVGTKIKYIYFFIGRMYQLIIAGVLTYLLCIILKI